MRPVSVPFLLALAAACSGCGSSSNDLHGTVKFKLRTVTQGQVVAVNARGETAMGDIQPDGSYRIEGCPSGKVKLTVVSPDPTPQPGPAWDERRGPKPPPPPPAPNANPSTWFEIPSKYADPDTSELTADVSGKTEFDIVME